MVTGTGIIFICSTVLMRVMCFEILSIFQIVKPIHKTKTGFSDNWKQPFLIMLCYWKLRFHISKNEFTGINVNVLYIYCTFIPVNSFFEM